jgi:hypothetical protein
MNYFLTEQQLKILTPITANCDIKDIWPNVPVASDFNLEPLLGSFFYNHLLSVYNNNTINSNELLLLPYLTKVVAWGTAAESVYSLHFQIKNKGVQIQDSDNSTAADSDDVKFLKRNLDQKKEFYMERLKHFLKTNKDLYPQLTDKRNTNCDADFRPNTDRGDSYNNDMLFI